ncbi:gas vesicle protein GvpQ [Virgibacillus halophilus]|uniref:Gas vesicle protein GvpQ n=1 Tax=Tigheibacillus halophilus TaxID=361280 RepID=A0ABU5C7Q3_9BACI|nr:gas vesicle protein GvpQ [Virgibacillus halophilus]
MNGKKRRRKKPRSNQPKKIEEKVQSKAAQASEKLSEKKDENSQKVHSKAEKAKDKTQQALLALKDKLGNLKEAGEEFQSKVSSSNNHQAKVKGMKDIKGISNIKKRHAYQGPGRCEKDLRYQIF